MPKKGLLVIHGAGQQPEDYCVPYVADLTRELGRQPDFLACWYADLSDFGRPGFRVVEEPASKSDMERVRQQLIDEVNMQAVESPLGSPNALGPGLGRSSEAAIDVMADVARYLTNRALATRIQARLRDVLSKAASTFDETILVGHSLGTVVTYDVLRADGRHCNVRHLVTMGSPLRKVVRIGLRPPDLGKTAVPTVESWLNLYDTTDLVANPIASTFREYPVQDVFTDNGSLPVESHDYWPRPQVLGIIADLLE